jgi:hypothetical protein
MHNHLPHIALLYDRIKCLIATNATKFQSFSLKLANYVRFMLPKCDSTIRIASANTAYLKPYPFGIYFLTRKDYRLQTTKNSEVCTSEFSSC